MTMMRVQIMPVRTLSSLAIITANPLPSGTAGSIYSLSFSCIGGQGNYVWSILKDYSATGLTMSAGGVLSGKPAVSGVCQIVVQVQDSGGASVQAAFSVTFGNAQQLVITTASLPNATAGSAYSTTLVAVGGNTPYTWNVVSDTPDTGSWLTVNPSTGVLSGTPGTAETESLRVEVQDAVSNSAFANLTLLVNAAASAGVQVGAGGKYVSALNGTTPVFLIGEHLNGTQFGPATDGSDPNYYGGYSAVTSLQWASWLQAKAALLPAGVARQKGTINHLRIGVGSAPYMAYTGISWDGGTAASSQYRALGINDDNGRPLYCASPTGGGKGTTPGTEVAGDPSAYRNFIDTILTNWFGAASIVGYPLYATLVLEFTTPQLPNGQALLCTDQAATLCVPDIAFWQAISAKYGSNKSILFELHNEPFGTNIHTDVEDSWLGQGNGTGAFNASAASFPFPTATTSPSGTNGGYITGISGGFALGGGQTCNAISLQQALNVCRTAGATNVIITGCPVASGRLASWSFNGGFQNVVDSYTVGGIRQMSAAFHAYNQFNTTAQADALVAGGVPFHCTEAGSITSVGGNGFASPGFSYARYLSNYSGYTWSSVSNFMQPPVANIYFDRGDSFANNFSLTGSTPWFCPNVPHLFPSFAFNDGSDTTQIPTASN